MTPPYLELWPDSSRAEIGSARMGLLRMRGGAEILIPLRSGRVAAAPLLKESAATGRLERVGRRIAWMAVRSGLAPLIVNDEIWVARTGQETPGLHEALGGAVGVKDVELAVAFGPPRPNRKPVVTILDRAGRVLGYGKIGLNELTKNLVQHEASILASRDGDSFRSFRRPRLIASFPWRDAAVAVYEPLVAVSGKVHTRDALEEIASMEGRHRTSLSGSDYLRGLRARILRLDEKLGEAITSALERLVEWDADLDFGFWHGDFSPWNVGASSDGRLIVWDWERAGAPAPVGFDAIHYVFQPLMSSRSGDLESLLARTSSTLSPYLERTLVGVDPGYLVRLYLIELYVRHASLGSLDTRSGLGILGGVSDL